ATMVAGLVTVFLSFVPKLDALLIQPFAFGMGPNSYNFMRALYGIVICTGIGIVVTWFTKARAAETIVGLTTGTQLDAMRSYKGGELNLKAGRRPHLRVIIDDAMTDEEAAVLPQSALDVMHAEVGDLIYVCDRRWWFGGLRSVHLRITGIGEDGVVRLGTEAAANARFEGSDSVYIEKIF
ncbi:MAG: hypothetical protein KJ060_06020, partial [Candidatus Hydrogenedentes bacterium]|nr:hypothetical protein [Candidatus Hydrogenedentota bacterium]